MFRGEGGYPVMFSTEFAENEFNNKKVRLPEFKASYLEAGRLSFRLIGSGG